MKFTEVPIDSEKINIMFKTTPILEHIEVIREDFEEFHKTMELKEDGNKIEDLQHYKTELFSTYCLGLLSTLDRSSQFNQKVIAQMKG